MTQANQEQEPKTTVRISRSMKLLIAGVILAAGVMAGFTEIVQDVRQLKRKILHQPPLPPSA